MWIRKRKYFCRMIADNVEVGTSLDSLLQVVASDRELHARWLNTLSMMEHVGATKIARRQSGPNATLLVLKHASEEARHAFFLKKMSEKLAPGLCPDYSDEYLLAPVASKQYLNRLDLEISRMLKTMNLSDEMFRWTAYLFVTWAIEVRADEIYPVYQKHLQDNPIKISMLSIINEEAGHLEEMETAMADLPFNSASIRKGAREIEENLYSEWLKSLLDEIPLS